MTRNYSTIDVEKGNNRVKYVNVTFNTLRSYITLYHTQKLLNYKGHIHMTRNCSTINVEKENNRVKKFQHHIQYTQDLFYIISHLPTIKL